MKYISILLGLMGLLFLGSVAFAEPINEDSDCVPVCVDIACWVWVDICGDSIYIDVEAEDDAACVSLPVNFGANCHAHIAVSVTRPTDLPAGVDMSATLENVAVTSGNANWYYFTDSYELCLNYLDPATLPAGTFSADMKVCAYNVDITDRAGVYSGGVATAYIWKW